MKILIILAHPDKQSFNHAIAKECKEKLIENGHSVIFHDLYEEKFDPILPSEEIPRSGKISDLVKMHCDDLIQSDGIIVVHPNWWGQPPAILKGWIDRVIRPGIAYGFLEGDNGEGVPVGLLKAKTAIVINTSNTSEKREIEIFGDPLETIWKNCIFDLCGVKQFERKIFRIVVTSDLSQRLQWLSETRYMIDKHFPIFKTMDPFEISVKRFDEFASEYAERFKDIDSYSKHFEKFCDLIVSRQPKVLELGCGPGNVTKYIKQRLQHSDIIAIDLAPRMIDIARQSIKDVDFRVMDVRDINSLDLQFDAIMCSFCLPFLSKADIG